MIGPGVHWGVKERLGWLDETQLVANLVIVAAILTVSRVLWTLYAKKGSASVPRSPRVLLPFAALIALCGVSHLVVVLVREITAPAIAMGLKVAAAALWVAIAAQFRVVGARLGGDGETDGDAPPPGACEGGAPNGLAMQIERLKIKTHMLENMISREPSLEGKENILAELREILDDLEAGPCRI